MTFLDFVTFLGVVMIVAGIALVFVPAALIVGGVLLAGSGVALSRGRS